MGRKRTSLMWQVDRETFQRIVNEAKSLKDIMNHFSLIASGMSYKILKRRLIEDNIDFSHIPLGLDSNKGRKFIKDLVPLEKVLTEKSTYDRGSIKKRLIANGMLKNECAICGMKPEWQGKPITLILDHINGVSDDNRLENLRIVCPNCNAQLATTNGKNRRKIKNCSACGIQITKYKKYCDKCRPNTINKIIKYKVDPKDKPSKEELEKLIQEFPMTKIGEKYGVSDNAIRKWCNRAGVDWKNRKNLVSKNSNQ